MVVKGSLLVRVLTMMHTKCLGGEYVNSGITRLDVPQDKVPWRVEWNQYSPPYFTAPGVKGKPWADPEELQGLQWNQQDEQVNRISHHGDYKVVDGYPLNPVGRTGLKGRGILGKWGPNHAADPIVTTWKRVNGSVVKDPVTNAPVLQFIGIKRRDTGEWAIPGGMVDPGEAVSQTLKREFLEESMDYLMMTPQQQADARSSFQRFFSNGTEIYKGYVDDRRNTDNAWIETVACNFHDETGDEVNKFKLKAGDDAVGVRWIDISNQLQLYASHKDFIKATAQLHSASWS